MLGRLLPLLALLLWTAPGAGAQDRPLRLDLNIPASRLIVYQGETPIRSYPVSVGLLGHDTPTGSFSVSRAEWNPWWRPPEREWARGEKVTPPGPSNPMGRVKLFFAPYYFIHGTPDSKSIGMPASHGCVRMLNKDAIELARLLHKRGAPSVSSRDIDRILSNSRQTRVVGFQETVPLVIRYDPVVVADGEVHVYPDVYRRNAVHTEGVYQALLAAGYDARRVDPEDVRSLVERARSRKAPWKVAVEEAFGREVASTLGYAAASP